MDDPREEMKELVEDIQKVKGLDNLSSKLVAELFTDPEEVSLNELADRTGYSLSAVSNKMKRLVDTGFVEKRKKPGSKKIYFYMEKSLIKSLTENVSEMYNKIIGMIEDRVPEIIERYKEADDERNCEKEIVERYYKEVRLFDELFQKFIEKLKEEGKDV